METERLTVRLPDNPFTVDFSRAELQAIVNQAADHGIRPTRRKHCPCRQANCSDPAPVQRAHNVGVRA